MIKKIQKTIEEWEEILPPKVFDITRGNGTEPPFENLYHNNYRLTGHYRCSNCGLHLFDADTQYDSGTGWPSFWKPCQKEHVKTRKELESERMAVVCGRCHAHLGHIFNDGPEPTGLRYCMNSAALIFIPETWEGD